MKSSQPLYLLSESQKDLQQQLSDLAQKESLKDRPVFLALADQKVFLKPFQLEAITPPTTLEDKLSVDAVEMLSVPIKDVVIDHYVISEHAAQLKGLYIGISIKRLKEYLQILLKFGLYPAQIVPYTLVASNYFFSQHTLDHKQYLFLDCFKPSWAVLGVFTQHQCVLMRLVHYESLDNLNKEISSSVLSACANSQVKECSGFYFYGDYEQKEALLRPFHTTFNNQVFVAKAIDLGQAFTLHEPAFPINLLRNEVLDLQEYRKVSLYASMLLLLVLLGLGGLGYYTMQQQSTINHLQATLNDLKPH